MSSPPERKLRLYFGDTLEVTTKECRRTYRLEEVPAPLGRAWLVRRHRPPTHEPPAYRVTSAGGRTRCDCPAGRRGRSCVHAGSIAKLLEEGSL